MSLVNKSRKVILMLTRALLRAWRAVLRRVTGKSELARILRKALIAENNGFSAELVRAVARSIAASSTIESPGVKGAVFGKHPFDVAEIARTVSEAEGISEEDQPSLVWCLHVSPQATVTRTDAIVREWRGKLFSRKTEPYHTSVR